MSAAGCTSDTGAHVIDEDGRLGPAERRRLVPPGRTLIHGFDASAGWHLSDRVCMGAIADRQDAAEALMAAVRGALLIAGPLNAGVAASFCDELRRLARASTTEVVVVEDAHLAWNDPLEALLAGLAEGLAVPEAARHAFVSVRTAHRRLAEARHRAGIATTAALVAHWARGRAVA